MPRRPNPLEIPREKDGRNEGEHVDPESEPFGRESSPLEQQTEDEGEYAGSDHTQSEVFDGVPILRGCNGGAQA